VPWTVILGENGVGKTILLQLLAALRPRVCRTILGTREDFLVQVDYVPDAMGIVSPVGPLGADILAEIKRGKRPPTRLDCEFALIGSYDRPMSSTTLERYHLTQSKKERFGPECSSIVRELEGFECYGYGAGRKVGKASRAARVGEDPCASLIDENVDLLNPEEWLVQTDDAIQRGDRSADEQLVRVKEVLLKLLSHEPIRDITFVSDTSSGGTPTTHVAFETSCGMVPLRRLSLGYRTLITWVLDLASRLYERYPDNSDPLAEPAVVLVDEIDLHLHPGAQRDLLPSLSGIFQNTQFIVTTHSALIVQAAPEDANIALLRREGDHVVIENDVKIPRNARVDQILTSDLFGLETARPPQIQSALSERDRLRAKADRTEAERQRLAELDAEIGDLPTAETASDQEAIDIVRRAAELLAADGSKTGAS